MGKTSDKVRQAKHRQKLKDNEEAYKANLEKDRLRKKMLREKNKMKPLPEQEAHKAAERVRIRNYRIQKKQRQQVTASVDTATLDSPYQSKQSTGKALQKVARSLPHSPRKKRFVIAKMAQDMGLEVKGVSNKRNAGITATDIDLVNSFYERNEISWQAPGRKDRVITRDVLANGESSKRTIQIRYLLMSLKEAYYKFKEEHKDVKIGLSKFCDLRPVHIKLFDKIPHNVCVCEYHENIRLILTVLECHTLLSCNFDAFTKQVTCNDSNKDCIYRRCDECRDMLQEFKPSPEEGKTLTKYQQWQTVEKRTEKMTITATVDDIFEELSSQTNGFLIHRFIKRAQANHFDNLIKNCDNSTIVLQVDFSENATLLQQDEVQSAHWNHSQVTIFTAHAWVAEDVKESFAIISDNLSHTKEAVYTFMSYLFCKLTEYPSVKNINVFSDGAASQFKQRYLFSNLHEWEVQFSTKLIWNFFATSHGKGAVDGIGGTVKRSVWRAVRAGTTAPLDATSYFQVASNRNPNINIVYISSSDIKEKSSKKLSAWEHALAIPNTLKLHCIKVHNSNQLKVSSISVEDSYTVVNIFTSADSSESDMEEEMGMPSDDCMALEINVGDWVLVRYDDSNFPGEVTNSIASDYEVSVMHKCGNAFWKWPLKEDKIYYNKTSITKKLDPPQVAGSRGQFIFKEL